MLGPSAVASRFEALRGSALTPLVGRDEDIDLLLRRWSRAKAGEGRVVRISGEPGIGKSRITVELERRLRTEPHLCYSAYQNLPSLDPNVINELTDESYLAVWSQALDRLLTDPNAPIALEEPAPTPKLRRPA